MESNKGCACGRSGGNGGTSGTAGRIVADSQGGILGTQGNRVGSDVAAPLGRSSGGNIASGIFSVDIVFPGGGDGF